MDKVPNNYPYVVDAVVVIILDILVFILIACIVACKSGPGVLQLLIWTACSGMYHIIAVWRFLPQHVRNLILNIGLFVSSFEDSLQQYNQAETTPIGTLTAALDELKTEVSTAASNLGTNASAA